MRMTSLTTARHGGRDEDVTVDLAKALKGDGKGVFNETEVKKAVRALKLQDRMRL